MQTSTIPLLALVLLAGCDIETRVRVPVDGATNINYMATSNTSISRPLKPTDSEYWLSQLEIYKCDDGTFEVFAAGVKHAGFATQAEARSERASWANALASRMRTSAPDSPCGVRIE